MKTNNYVESWHNQVKTSYLQRRRNRRVGRLVCILINDVEEDFISNINRIRMNVGRMGPEAREARRRELEAEEVSIHVAMDMISEVERASLYNVQSFNNADETYKVRVENDTTFDTEIGLASICSFWDVVLNMTFGEVRNANAREKENSNAFHFKGPTYTEVSTIEGLQSEPEHELQREQEDMVQKLKTLKEVVENLRPDEVTSSWRL
ncbi:hypothetical protein RMATCC62417_06678 [Rhizopus microsporus]|nr:hypothetical protein RMATCC62417_06678 [Rhizopus microsporus]